MTLGTNLKHLRKDVLKLSRIAFGEKLGVSADVINNIELGRLARPEQKEPLLRLVCETFNVSYQWLTKGKGEMYVITKQTFIEKLASEYNLSPTGRKIIESYLNLDEGQRSIVDDFMALVADSIDKAKVTTAAKSAPFSVVDNVIERTKAQSKSSFDDNDSEEDAFLEMARQQFRDEKAKGVVTSFVNESDVG